MKISRYTARRVRYWVPRFRLADDEGVRVYHRYAHSIYVYREARIIERVTRSEGRRRARAVSES